ncbi:MAG TPA: cyclase [Clostridiales bacterium]|nr:cyclase [Clostridiales bacterium]
MEKSAWNHLGGQMGNQPKNRAGLPDHMIDISVTLSESTVIYPGDPLPEYGLIFSLANGEIANVGYLKHGIHHGTHVDVPCHFIPGAPTFDQMPASHWIGSVLVADMTHVERAISGKDIERLPLAGVERLLLKTQNSLKYYKLPQFTNDFIYLERSACEAIVSAGVKTVGLDYITVDPHGSPDFPAHRTLLGHGVCIIECINLENTEAGEYYLMCLPLKLEGTDGAPARAILLEKGFQAFR